MTVGARTIVAIILIAAGTLGLAFDKFTYTEETHDAEIGPFDLEVKEKETVHIPAWLGIGAIAAGVAILLVGRGKPS